MNEAARAQPSRRVPQGIADVLSGLAMLAWVGGQAALGAFAARIAFQELARPDAARTMNRVFHEFDRVIIVAIVMLAFAALLGLWARGLGAWSQIRFGLELGLAALGLFEVLHVHPGIEAMFTAGRTLEPAFAALHHLSERCAHAEAALVVALLIARTLSAPTGKPA